VLGRGVRSLRLRAADAADALLGRREELVPPRHLLDFVGDSDFVATGDEFVGYFRDLGDLQPTDRVLDVGCGIGRMARVLARELAPPGSSDGFDISAKAIAWCTRHYMGQPVPFRFRHADLRNTLYNPAGVGSAASYRFPYADGSFDFVIATSVFTHLLGDGAAHYLDEVARVLAPGGRLFATWFLLGERPPPPDAAFAFVERLGDAVVADPAVPEAAVAYSESWLREQLRARDLRLRDPLRYGSWRGERGLSFQDIAVAERR
jgi:SAM-dependent methyltransferase